MEGGIVSQRTEGTPQGSPWSPWSLLLSNIILDELDKEPETRGHYFVSTVSMSRVRKHQKGWWEV